MTTAAQLAIRYFPTADLVPAARNARTHTAAQIKQIAASIKTYGWTTPVLIDDKNTIIAGHGRILAAQQLGIEQIPTIPIEWLTDDQRRAYLLLDNRLTENGGWDMETLGVELSELKKLGFDMAAFDSIPRPDGQDKAATSPWQRMQGDPTTDGVPLTCGAIETRIDNETYELLVAHIGDLSPKTIIEAMINEYRNS